MFIEMLRAGMARNRRYFSLTKELLQKSREAALSAIQIFNNPLIKFKSETYIVLMTIAWTYLLHAYYRKSGTEYRYFEQGPKRRVFKRTKRRAYVYWELERCLRDSACPVDNIACKNLLFLIEIRHEIEHQMTMRLDDYLSGRYQACAMNYNHYIKKLFGEQYGIEKYLTYSLQFLDLSYEQISQAEASEFIPEKLQNFIAEFDSKLSEDEYNSNAYSYRLIFTKKLVNHPGQADRVVEFIAPDSELAQSIQSEFWVKKEVEKPKYLPSEVVRQMQREGYVRFKMHHHSTLWKTMDARKQDRRYGVQVARTWYWYDSWLDVVREHCAKHKRQYT